MLITLAWRQLWATKKLTLILLLVLSLMAGFAAALPLYRGRLAAAAAQIVANDLSAEMATITLSQSVPIDPGALEVIGAALGDIGGQTIADSVRFSRAPGTPDYPGLGKICGYRYVQGERLLVTTPLAVSTVDHCAIPYSFADLESLFALVDGRWPEVLSEAALESPRVMDAPQVEAVLGVEVAELTHIQTGDRLVIGEQADHAVVVEIVGLVAPLIPEDGIFWHGHTITQRGEWTPIGDDMRLEIAPIVPQAAFERWIVPLTNTPYYAWWMNIDPGALSAADWETLDADLYQAESQLRLTQPEIELLTGIRTATAQYHAQVAQFEDVLVVMGAALCGLLVVLGIASALLVFDHHRSAWFLLMTWGANRRQMVALMLLPLVGLVGISAVLGLLWAWFLVAFIGPEMRADEWALTFESLLYSVGGGVLALLVLALPAWIVARRSQHPPRPAVSYPPQKTIWARFFMDVILLVAGLVAMFRLYYLASNGLAQSLRDLAGDPALLTRRIAAGQVGAASNGLGDPFNLAGPALIVIGLVLLWMRLYPWLARIPAQLAGLWGGMAGLCAWQQVTRAPGQYAALVLTLAGPLVLGAGSLVLDALHDSAAWDTARHETGTDVQVWLDLRDIPASQNWDGVPGVADTIALIKLDATQPPVTVLGVAPDALPAVAAIPAFGAPNDTLPGILLPDSTAALEVSVYSVPNPDDPGTVTLALALLDRRGVPITLPMEAASAAENEFVIHRSTLPDNSARRPWRLVGVRFASERRTRQTIYLDQIITVDAQNQPTLIESFEADMRWIGSTDQPDNALVSKRSTDQVAEGTFSLHIDYETKYTKYADLQPLLLTTPPDLPVLPVIVSEAFIAAQSQRTDNEPRLVVGDTGGFRLEFPLGGFWLPYRIVAIVSDFPTMAENSRFIIAPFEALRLMMNASVRGNTVYDANQVWLELDDGTNTADLHAAIDDMPGVVEVTLAAERYDELKHDPALLAVIGLLRFGFVTGVGLSVLYLIAYGHVIVPRRRASLAVLRTLGGHKRQIERAIVLEIALWVLPLMVVSAILGALLIYLLLPFLPLLHDVL